MVTLAESMVEIEIIRALTTNATPDKRRSDKVKRIGEVRDYEIARHVRRHERPRNASSFQYSGAESFLLPEMAAIARYSRISLFGGRSILRPLASLPAFELQKQPKNCKYYFHEL